MEAPFDLTWERMMSALSRSFFAIETVEKASHVVAVSFRSDRPADYVDCGISHRNGGPGHVYSYAVAGSNTFTRPGPSWGGAGLPSVLTLARHASLEGHIDVYVAPEGPGTQVSVNAHYVLRVVTRGSQQRLGARGAPVGSSPVPGGTSTIAFESRAPGGADWGEPGQPQRVRCVSRGVLETQILALAAP